MVNVYQLVGVVLCMGFSTCSPPMFIDFPVVIEKYEGHTIGSHLFSFTMSDPTQGHTVRITASPPNLVEITPPSGQNSFTVNVTLSGDLDREIASQHQLRFVATDNDSNQVIKTLIIYVNDINDNPPSFQNVPYFWDIPELQCNTSITRYTRIHAADPDVGLNGTVTYSIIPVTQSNETSVDYLDTFSIDNNTGAVSLKKCLSYLNNSYYQFLVVAKDRGSPSLSSNVSLVIRVRDVQNQPPFFTGVPYRRSIDEGTSENHLVLVVNARDGDTGVPNKVKYSIDGGTCNDSFTIDGTNGRISTTTLLDRDSGSINDADGVCVLNIRATEIESNNQTQYGNITSTTDVTITVDDINDNAPYFNNTTYYANITENAQKNVPLNMLDGQIHIFDDDQVGDFSTMNIRLQWPNTTICDSFKASPNIVRKSGSIIIQVEDSSILDFERVQQLNFTIIATEIANTSHTASADVILSISDENDNSPQFTQTKYEFEIFEGTSTNESVGNITADDADSGDYKNVTYSLLGSEDEFEIDPLTGEITTKCDPIDLDRETISLYYLTVTATDDGGQGRSNSTSVKIELRDVNDNTPVFLRDVYQTFVKENDDYSNISVLTVSAQDIDEHNTNNSAVEFFLNEPATSWITSNISISLEGEIHFIHPIDYEKLPDTDTGRFNFTVYARDLGQPQLTGNATVEITVEDVNDNTPIFNKTSYMAAVPENATSTGNALFSVLNVSATDMDGSDRNSRFQYFISNGANNRFSVDPDTGNVYVQRNAMLDREKEALYNITMEAIDLGTKARTGTTQVIINVTDVNDELPQFNSTTCVTSGVSEGAPTHTPITTCDATDADETPNLHYNITNIHASDEDGNAVNVTLVQNYFRIFPDNGTVFVAEKLDRETAETVVLTINVTDLNGQLHTPQVVSKTLTIRLLDVNDNDPVFSSYNYTMSVSENARDPTRLDTIQATDADVNRTITYTIDSGEVPTKSFRIDNKTGIIYKDGPLDREVDGEILLHVRATDNGVPTRNSNTTVLIDVIDYNDNSPGFYPNSTNPYIAIAENVTNGTVVTSIGADDVDDGPNAVVVYEIESGTEGQFGIDRKNGTIYTTSKLDREKVPVYTITILAKDNPTDTSVQRANRTVLTINITDVNDNDPIFTQTQYNVTIQETAGPNETVTTITATDKDKGVNSELSYSFKDNTDPPGLFGVEVNSGKIYVNSSLTSQVGSYLVHLMAEDGGEPSLNGSTVVNITVADVNINSPVIDDLPENDTIRVHECFNPGTVIYRFNYSDKDHGENAKAFFNITSIDADNVLDKFSITENGLLAVKDDLDANTASSYRFQIHATDRGLPSPLSSEKHTINIHVIDVNNFRPGFKTEKGNFTVRENEPNGTTVGTVTAVDDDVDSVSCYNINDTLDSGFFIIGKKSGTITTKRSIDREVDGGSLSIVVTVYDCTVSEAEETCGYDTDKKASDGAPYPNITVTIHIKDVDDNPPVFIANEISVGMRRNEEVGFILDIDLKNGGYVKDNDTDQYGKQAWIFSNNGTAIASTELAGKAPPGSGTSQCPLGGAMNLFCVTGNGTIVNNKFFSEDMSGFVLLPVSVEDSAGSDKTMLKIYLISDSQVLLMTIFDTKQHVATYKDELLELYSNITKYTFVYDGLQDHKTPTSIDTSKSDLYFHIVDPLTQRILPSNEAQRLVDAFYELLRDATSEYKVLQVLASTASQQVEEDDPMRTVYILSAVVVLLVLTVAIIVYVSLTLRSRYQRKIKALTVDKIPIVKKDSNAVIPGSNHYSKTSNPLLNANIDTSPKYDTYSVCSNDSIDKNEVGAPRDENLYDELEVKQKSMELYIEDVNPEWSESPLDAALRMHDMKKASVDEIDGGSVYGDGYADSDNDQSHEKVAVHGFMNEGFEMETSEI